MDERTFWERINGILDVRGDPVDDPEVLSYLEANPSALESFADLRAGLALVEGSAQPAEVPAAGDRRPAGPPVTAAHAAGKPSTAAPLAGGRFRAWVPAAAAALAAGLLWMLWPPAEPLSVEPGGPAAGVILDYEIRFTVAAASGRTARAAYPKGWRVERIIEPGHGPALATMTFQRRTSP